MNALQSVGLQSHAIRLWRYDGSPLPEWMPPGTSGDIEANGTFPLNTELGLARVHPGNIVVEQHGALWVRSSEDLSDLISELKLRALPSITTIGPGKTNQFGNLVSRKKNRNIKATTHTARLAPPIGSQPSIEWVHLDRLSVDGTYQRTTENAASQRLIGSIAAKFDWRLCAPLVVARRSDDSLVIIDGQHRWMAALKRADIPQLPCCIFRYGSREEEARMFIVANRARKPMNRLDDYFAALAALDEDALEIQQIVTGVGLKIARNTAAKSWLPGEIAFTSSIAKAIRRFGPETTSSALASMVEAFPNQKLNHGGAIFGGLIAIMSKPPENLDPDRLVEALKTLSADDWGLHAEGLNGGDSRIAALRTAILGAYEKLAP